MGGLVVRHLIPAGASQSAARLRTYINGVHLLENVFDGFIPYIDFSSTIPFKGKRGGVEEVGGNAPRSETISMYPFLSSTPRPKPKPIYRQDNLIQQPFDCGKSRAPSHVNVPRSMAASGTNEGPNWMSYQPAYQAAIGHTHNWIVSGRSLRGCPQLP
ncbi:MAG: hypothetical protein Ct9H300mP8_05670 [Gammaproteobacteria bacterium]|nr:MAG: hypothetical protein Ct9H300mP8_05670 [Gammaproteobacteria bacterium]